MLESAEKLNNQAVEYVMHGNFDDAIACLKRAVIVEKENFILWYNLALTYRDSGDYEDAIYYCKHAYDLNPDSMEVITTLTNLYFANGDIENAKNYCTAGFVSEESNPEIWNLAGVIAFSEKDYEHAAAAFQRAVELNPFFYEALYNLRDTYEALGNERGVKECKRILSGLTPPSR